MNDAAILVLNLTFLVILGVAFLMFLGTVVLGTVILLLAGAGHVLAFAVLLPFGRYRKNKARALALSTRRVSERLQILASAFSRGIRGIKART